MRADWRRPLPTAHGAVRIIYDLFYDTVELVDALSRFAYLSNNYYCILRNKILQLIF